jgi:hypothetical protein
MPNAETRTGFGFGIFSAFGIRHSSLTASEASEKWAHQDSNLERAGYEPAALTVELWARPR